MKGSKKVHRDRLVVGEQQRAILGLSVDLHFGGRRRVEDIEDIEEGESVFLLMMAGSFK